MKCDGCPIADPMVRYIPRVSLKVTGYCGRPLADCHLAPASFARIWAEINGEWRCYTCANEPECYLNAEKGRACEDWQPRKQEEE